MMTTTKTTSISFRASTIITVLGAILACSSSSVTAFAPAPAHRQAHFGSSSSTTTTTTTTIRDVRQAHRNPIVRSSSYTLGDGITGARTSTSSSQSRKSPSSSSAVGWVRAKVSQASGVRRGSPSPSQAQQKGDWSKLFATPEREMAQGALVGGLSRSCAGLAEGSCGSSLIFFGMVSLVYTFAPVFAAQSLVAWGLGRAAYWWSMRSADVSQRLPAGFVGYMSLFLMVGGLSFMNGLKAIALIA